MTDNEMIAKFMGGVFYGPDDLDNPNKWWFQDQPHEGYRRDAHHLTSGLRYNIDWSWLIPVVEKINEIGVWTIRPGFAMVQNPNGELRPEEKFKFIKSDFDFEEVNGNPVDWIIIVHSVAVEFIKWHNKTHKP